MRVAISAGAALSGLLLLGLAFYGQPALYLHQVRQEWNALMDEPAEPPADPDRDLTATALARQQEADRVARLQEQVAQLQNQLALKRAAIPPSVTPALPQAALPQPAPPQPAPPQPAPPLPSASEPAPAPIVQLAAPTPAPSPLSQPPVMAQLHADIPHPDAPRTAPSLPEPPRSAASVPMQAGPRVTASSTADPTPQVTIMPQRHETAAAVPPPPKLQSPRTEPSAEASRTDSSRPAPIRLESPRPELPKTAPQKLASAKSIPAPPPVALSSPTRQDTDDAQSVLARLRQSAPAAAPVQQPDTPEVVEPKPQPIPSPSLPGLTAARAALAKGRVEDTRRLLQQIQLQLVFRPVGASGDDAPSAGKGAADVAHALDALSANDASLSRRYIDTAISDLSGSGTSSTVPEPRVRTNGYAPAYPTR